MLGTWTPNTPSETPLSATALNDFLQHIPDAIQDVHPDAAQETKQRQETALSKWLLPEQQAKAHAWLSCREDEWRDALIGQPPEALLKLAFFYVLAEMQLPDFTSNDQNPAIWVFRHLKAHGALPDKSHIRALKRATDNRFIPYGSVL